MNAADGEAHRLGIGSPMLGWTQRLAWPCYSQPNSFESCLKTGTASFLTAGKSLP